MTPGSPILDSRTQGNGVGIEDQEKTHSRPGETFSAVVFASHNIAC